MSDAEGYWKQERVRLYHDRERDWWWYHLASPAPSVGPFETLDELLDTLSEVLGGRRRVPYEALMLAYTKAEDENQRLHQELADAGSALTQAEEAARG